MKKSNQSQELPENRVNLSISFNYSLSPSKHHAFLYSHQNYENLSKSCIG